MSEERTGGLAMPVHDWTKVDAGIFHDFHTAWIGVIRTALNTRLLPEDYYALAEPSAGDIGPDVLTLERRHDSDAPHEGNGTGAKVVSIAPPAVKLTFHRERHFYLRKQRRLVIRHKSEDRLVAVLEIVSPGNIATASEMRRFVNKAAEVLNQGIHLLVVDLLPPTARAPLGMHGAVWSELGESDYAMPPNKRLTLAAYRVAEEITAYVEPIAVGDVLIDMPLFLTEEEYVDIPLEKTYLDAWQGVPRHLRRVMEG
jgi:hypothetical protein